MPIPTSIREFETHQFSGSFPAVESYSEVDWDLLTAGDDNPFVITLAVAQIGRVSQNGLVYDALLVHAIAGQLRGSGGMRGHIAEGQESTAFPVDAVDWIGHLLDEDGKLWAKGYIPPGETREQIRRAKARGGSLGTSIYGYGVREWQNEEQGHWTSNDFELHSLDLAPPKMASLQMDGDFLITAETTQNENVEGEGAMPDDNITLNDIPETVREQIIEQARLASDLSRVRELQESLTELSGQVSELSELGAAQIARIAEIETERDDAQTIVAEYREAAFETAIEARIVELSNWQVSEEEGKKRLAALRSTLRRAIIAEVGAVRDEAQVEAAIQSAWDANQVLADMTREALAGPNVRHGGNTRKRRNADGDAIDLKAEDAPEELKKKYGMN